MGVAITAHQLAAAASVARKLRLVFHMFTPRSTPPSLRPFCEFLVRRMAVLSESQDWSETLVRRSLVESCAPDKIRRNSALARSQCRQRKRRLDFLPLRPIVIRVAFEAPRLGMLRPRRVTLLASRNPGKQHVACLRAAQRFFMAAHAGEAAMRVVIKICMRHPLGGDVGIGDFESASREFV